MAGLADWNHGSSTDHPADWPAVAGALQFDCPVWTEDEDFFGSGVATWTTATVEIFLRGE